MKQILRIRPGHRFIYLHTRSLSNYGKSIYSWGTGDEGQLGHTSIIKTGFSNTYVELSPREIESFPRNLRFTDISSGFTHCGAVTDNGEVYTWGLNEYGKLGHSNVTESAAKEGHQICMIPTKVQIPDDDKIKQIVCGEFHTAALSYSGKVYTWGWGGSLLSGAGCLGHGDLKTVITPKLVSFPDGIKISSISSGKYHMSAIGLEGEVWSWGKGEFGKHGNGANSDVLRPEPVEYFIDCDIRITKLSCGSNYTLALSDDFKVYGWGSNDNCQLGLGGGFAVDMFSMEEFPKQIEKFEADKEQIVDISSGLNHAIGITKTGQVYLWGMKLWMEPHKVKIYSADSSQDEVSIIGGSCGSNYTVVFNDAGQLYSWGKGVFMRNSGCLGLGHTKRTVQPELIEGLKNTPIQKVSAGNKSCLALSGLPSVAKDN